MQKKSNKTAHVLSLLTNDSTVNEELKKPMENEEAKREKTASPIEKPASSAAKPAGPIIEFKGETSDDPVSDLIRDKLKEMVHMDGKDNDADTENEKQLEQIFTDIFSGGSKKETKRTAELPFGAQQQLQKRADATHADKEKKAHLPSMDFSSDMLNVHGDLDDALFCVNIVELLLREHIYEYMEAIDMCTCDQCMNDTLALALNHIKPKYVVSNKGRLYSSMDFYDKQYTAHFMAEVIKAAVKVKNSPKHEISNNEK